MGDAQQLRYLVQLCGDEAQAMAILLLYRALVQVDVQALGRVCSNLDQADALGPVLDPTQYRAALQSGRLPRSQQMFRALRDCAIVVQRVSAEAVLAAGEGQ